MTGALLLGCSLARAAAAGGTAALGAVRYLDPEEVAGQSMAVVVPEQALLHTGQFTGDGRARDPGAGAGARIHAALDELDAHLREAGSDLRQVVKLNACVTDALAVPAVRNALAGRFPPGARPAVSFVVTPLIAPAAVVAFDAVATLNAGSSPARVTFPAAPRTGGGAGFQRSAVLPAGGVVYVAGQAERGDLAKATRKTLESLARTLRHLGRSWADVVQLRAFLQPMTQWPVAAREMEAFAADAPAPPVVFVEWAGSPDHPIEIELIAAAGGEARAAEARMEFITPPGMTASPVYSRVVRVNRGPRIYTSGLYSTGASDAAGQVREVFETMGELLAGARSDLSHLAKATYYVADAEVSARLDELRHDFYDPQRPPAASKALVKGVGLDRRRLALDMIAVPRD